VLGMGNSAMDIAVEASFVAEHTYLAARRGAHILPKYIFGKPIDQIGGSPLIPFGVRRKVMQGMLKVYLGDMERYGLPKPDHRFGDAHPTVSDDILSRMAHGTIAAKPNIASLTRDGVRFTDGSEVKADIVVYCTGYKVTFPFFDEGFISAPDNDLPLFRRTFHPDIPNVFFIGLLQPLGAIMPIAEHQSTWVGDYLGGRYALPSPADLRADIERERRAMFKRYVASKRHTMQIDFDDYLVALAKERKAGEERARAHGNRPPVPPRAAMVAA
jgi:dimethylaniline monooxygenase (N-oxide forming)